MSDEKWEKVLWRRQPFPDNYVPPSFLSSLRRNCTSRRFFTIPGLTSLFETQQTFSPTLTGNWSPSLTQSHSIYPPYSSSWRRSSGSRSECWTHVFSSGHRYSHLPSGISFGKSSRSRWRTSSARCGNPQTVRRHAVPPSFLRAQSASSIDRCKGRQVIYIGVPSAAVLVPGDEDADSVHILGFDLGTRCVPVHSQCFDCGLQLPAPRDLHPRKVCLRSLCYTVREPALLTVGRPGLHQCFLLTLLYLHRLFSRRDCPTTSRCLPLCCTPWFCLRCSRFYATDYR